MKRSITRRLFGEIVLVVLSFSALILLANTLLLGPFYDRSIRKTMLAAMEELGMIPRVATPATVFIAFFDKDRLGESLRLAAAVRAGGLGVELFPEPKKLGLQLKYADRRGFRFALVAGAEEFEAGVVQLKDLATGEKENVAWDPSATAILAALGQRLTSGGGK